MGFFDGGKIGVLTLTNEVRSDNDQKLEKIDIREIKHWKMPPKTFEQKASLEIARWVLGIFAAVLILCFIIAFTILVRGEVMTYENSLELIRTMISSILPLVTLAVGYYLGDKGNSQGF